MGNIGKCSLIEVSADAVVQLVLAQCVQSVLNAAYLAVNRSHDQTKHHHTQRREQKITISSCGVLALDFRNSSFQSIV